MSGILEYSQTPASNTAVNGIAITGSSSLTLGDDAMRQMMADSASAITRHVTKAAGTYSAAKADFNQLWRTTGAVTINLTAAATLTDGWCLWVKAGGTVTIDPSGSETIDGAATLTLPDGASAFILCTGTAFVSVIFSNTVDALNRYREFWLSNNASDATNDIDITDQAGIFAAFTKRLDATWAVGTNQGGLDTGSIANTTYHVWLIRRPDTGVVDALFSTSATSPTMPTNYTQKRRIGSILRESGTIVSFKQTGDTFKRQAVIDRNSTAAFADALLALSVPAGIVVAPIVQVSIGSAGSVTCSVALGNATAGAVDVTIVQLVSSAMQLRDIPPPLFMTDTSRQIRFAQTNSAGTPSSSALTTLGWVDLRDAA